MSTFKFSLQPVLNHRTDVEEEKKNEYQKARQNLQEESQKTKQLIHEINEIDEQLTRTGKVQVTQLYQLLHYRNQVHQKLIRQQQIQEESEQKVEVAQQFLLQAKLDVQVLEKLKEKSYTHHVYQEKLEEVKLLDELSCINYGRA
ncbi:flagellar export protein FliJ [Turicibacter sanguinis]|uniref:flagellar export protein FliJ n=1 Tax=Turicibacter sanguinis TaxID=154288 RepID=UPI0018ABE1BD|nr:flagellar export protein FliJ [Turicibacter sanguinis]MDB8551143.1 flagellar export protein FliJ [Turicibacter sanguinis]